VFPCEKGWPREKFGGFPFPELDSNIPFSATFQIPGITKVKDVPCQQVNLRSKDKGIIDFVYERDPLKLFNIEIMAPVFSILFTIGLTVRLREK